MSFKERLKQLIEIENLTQLELSEKTGVNRSTIANTLTKDNSPGGEFIASIIAAFPKLNARWFTTGEGEMWLEENLGDVALYKRMLEEHKSLLSHAHLIIDVWQKKYEDVKEELEELQAEVKSLRKQLKEQKKEKKETK